MISVMSRGSSGPMSANVTTPVTAATPSTYRPSYLAGSGGDRDSVSYRRADMVTKSRAHAGSKNVCGPCTVEATSLVPSAGAARSPGASGS
jgi:hypothetical protein